MDGEAVQSTYTALALENQDIVEQIFSHFEALGDGRLNPTHMEPSFEIWLNPDPAWKSHLLHAALSCKAFLFPALGVLWSVLDRPDILFPLIPGIRLIDGKYVLAGEVTDDSMERFNLYARRVRQLFFSPDKESGAFANPTTNPLRLKFHGALLPGLKVLHLLKPVQKSTMDDHAYIMPFIPTTVSLIMASSSDIAGDLFISSLLSLVFTPGQSSQLKHLRLEGALEKSCSHLSKFLGLTTLEISTEQMEQEVLHNISGIATLITLEICDIKHHNETATTNRIHVFPSLRDVHFSGFSKAIHRILLSVQVPKLRFLHVSCSKSNDIFSVAGCFRASLGLPGSSPVRIVLQYNGELTEMLPLSFSELFSVPLSVLSLGGWRPAQVGPQPNILTLPNTTTSATLRQLLLQSYEATNSSSYDPSHLTLDTLAAIATNCPNLQRLSISVFIQLDPSSSEAWETPLFGAGINHPLPWLRLGLVNESEDIKLFMDDWRLGLSISCYIDRIFPALKSMSSYTKDWPCLNMVFSMLGTYQDVRREFATQLGLQRESGY